MKGEKYYTAFSISKLKIPRQYAQTYQEQRAQLLLDTKLVIIF